MSNLSRELPANSWLGYSLNLSTITTLDITAVRVIETTPIPPRLDQLTRAAHTQATRAVLKASRILDYDTEKNLRPVCIDGKTYDVPAAITVMDDDPSSQGEYIHYASGTDASVAFRNDTSLGMRYFAVNGPESVTLSSERALTKGNQYAFYSFTKTVYNARLTNYAHLLNVDALWESVADLTRPFVGTNPDIVEEYKHFFQSYGSHVIVSGNYGARFQLNVWASNKTKAVNDKFGGDVLAMFDGIPNGGEFDPALANEAQYKTFLEYVQKLVSVSGGDPVLAQAISSNPSSFSTFERWLDSVQTTSRSVVLSFKTVEIWSLMAHSVDPLLRDSAESLSGAFAYILNNHRTYKTAITFEIQSDWAEFNLLTPSAVIEPNPEHPHPPNTVASSTRVHWGKDNRGSGRQTLMFFVSNDGAPIDFSISHSSKGGTAGTGRAVAIIEGSPYINDYITDDVWNTHWFYQAPVSAVPEKENVRL